MVKLKKILFEISLSKQISVPKPNVNSLTNLKEPLVCLFYDTIKSKSTYSEIIEYYFNAPKTIHKNEFDLKKNDLKLLKDKLEETLIANGYLYGEYPKNIVDFIYSVFYSKLYSLYDNSIKFIYQNNFSTIGNGFSCAKVIRKEFGTDYTIFRNDDYNLIRFKATELAKTDYGIKGLPPDNWCPGDIFLAKGNTISIDEVNSAKKAVNLNVDVDGSLTSLNSQFSKKGNLIAVSLKEEKARGGKATTFAARTYRSNKNIDYNENLKDFIRVAYAIKIYGDRNGKIDSELKNIIINYTGIKNIKDAVEQSKRKLKKQLKNLKDLFIEKRTEFIKNIEKEYKSEVEIEKSINTDIMLQSILNSNEKDKNIIIERLAKKTAAYDIAFQLIRDWANTKEVNKGYKKIAKESNIFVALTAFALASAGISPSFWKITGNSSGKIGKSEYFSDTAKISILTTETSKILLIDSFDKAGFDLKYITKISKRQYRTTLSFLFSKTTFKIEVEELKKI